MPESTRTPSPSSAPNRVVVLGTSKRCTEPACGCQPLAGILGVQPGLDGVAARGRRSGVEAAAVGDEQLQADEVETGGGLGDRVLDLQPGVHLEEEEVAGPSSEPEAMNSTVPAPV